MEASSALVATRRSSRGGVASALVGTRPRVASARPNRASIARVIMIPRMKLRIFPPRLLAISISYLREVVPEPTTEHRLIRHYLQGREPGLPVRRCG